MTTDPNWLKSITESYRQEVSESARNLQEEAEDLYNLVETIQTALNVDLTEEQVDALIEAFRSTIDPKTGAHKPGVIRQIIGFANNVGARLSTNGSDGLGSISNKNEIKQEKIHRNIDLQSDPKVKKSGKGGRIYGNNPKDTSREELNPNNIPNNNPA